MHRILRKTAITAAVLGAVALSALPAFANSIQEEGDFGGTYRRIGPSDAYRYGRDYYAPAPAYYGPSYYGPSYYAPTYYGPSAYYGDPYAYDGPGVALVAPGIGIGIGAY